MKSAVLYRQGIGRSHRSGSTLAAALALVFLVFAVTTVMLTRVACSWSRVSLRHKQAAALFLAEAGVSKAGQRLTENASYSGEKGTRLETGSFDVKVSKCATGYDVTSIGRADASEKLGRKKTVQAIIRLTGGGRFRVENWRENL